LVVFRRSIAGIIADQSSPLNEFIQRINRMLATNGNPETAR